MTQQPLVDLSHISVAYGDRVALDDVSLALGSGEIVAFVGPNGAGKSTMLKAIAGHVRPDRGSVAFSPTLGAKPRREIVYVPQRDKLDWTLPASVLDLVLMGAYRETSRWRPLRRESTDAALRALEVVGMSKHAGTQIGRLSGGQQQRVILARALIRPAAIYLLDEPFTGVDAPTEALFEEVIVSLRDEGKCVVMATHNLDCARDISDRVVILSRRIVAVGPPAEALTPLTIAVAFGDISRLNIHGEDAHVHE
ncbi:MAG TPA: manganese ABC transporter ATP-binding protein [Chloroflexi bacterium]|jgi:manganese/zinc/iron transport system ATP- binding protein|nr:manganese ABC transporter ATP-binding protein [Chloroflexota bacterium]